MDKRPLENKRPVGPFIGRGDYLLDVREVSPGVAKRIRELQKASEDIPDAMVELDEPFGYEANITSRGSVNVPKSFMRRKSLDTGDALVYIIQSVDGEKSQRFEATINSRGDVKANTRGAGKIFEQGETVGVTILAVEDK